MSKSEISRGEGSCENVLWTGGWDSTYRLLERTFIEGRDTQPWYLIDAKRKSVHYEIRAMSGIMKELRARVRTQEQISPIRFVLLDDIKVNKDIQSAFADLRKKVYIGEQYEWIAHFAEHFKIKDIEVGMPLHIPTPALYKAIFKKNKAGYVTPELVDDEKVKKYSDFIGFR